MDTEVFVFADWEQFTTPTLVGMLRSSTIKNKEHFSFTYDDTEAQVMYNWAREQEETGDYIIERYEWLLEQFSESSVVDAVKQRLAVLKSDDQ